MGNTLDIGQALPMDKGMVGLLAFSFSQKGGEPLTKFMHVRKKNNT